MLSLSWRTGVCHGDAHAWVEIYIGGCCGFEVEIGSWSALTYNEQTSFPPLFTVKISDTVNARLQVTHIVDGISYHT